MLSGKLGKPASGLISLKEKNNSQGLFENLYSEINTTSKGFHKGIYWYGLVTFLLGVGIAFFI